MFLLQKKKSSRRLILLFLGSFATLIFKQFSSRARIITWGFGCLKHDMIDNEVFCWLWGVYYVYEDLEVMTYSIAGMSREDGWTRGSSHVRCWPSCKGQGQGALHLSTPPLPWSNQSTEIFLVLLFEKLYSVPWFILTKPQEALNTIVKVSSLKIKVRQVFHFFQKHSWFFSWYCEYQKRNCLYIFEKHLFSDKIQEYFHV